jgi:hypothetical protein
MASLNNAEMGRARANSNNEEEVWEVPTNWVVEKGNKPSSANTNFGAFSKVHLFFQKQIAPKQKQIVYFQCQLL